jgi:hypothetical protein
MNRSSLDKPVRELIELDLGIFQKQIKQYLCFFYCEEVCRLFPRDALGSRDNWRKMK